MAQAQAAIPMSAINTIIPASQRITESKLVSIQQAEEARKKAEALQNEDPLLSIAKYVRTAWQAAYNSKQTYVQERLLASARQRKGEYDPGKWGDLKREGGSEIYMMITNQKCRFLESWLKDVELPPGSKPWSIDPTPVPDLPPSMEKDVFAQVEMEVTQIINQYGPNAVTTDWVIERLEAIESEAFKKKSKMAAKTAKRIEQIIEDQLVEGGYYEALYDFITDFATYPAAILKGPTIRRKPKLVWTEDRNGNNVPAVEQVYAREYSCVSPHDAYPSPGSKGVNDGYFIERLRLRRRDLEACIGVPGFDDDAIRAVLTEHGTGGLREWLAIDQEREWVENRENSQDDPDPPIEGLEFWGSIQGKLLQEWGMDKKMAPDANKDYQISCWLIGRWVVMARLNPHPLGRRPYYVSSYEKINGSFWGQCPPELMRDLQLICNATARALANNLAIASGPQTEVDIDRLMPGADPEDIYPWKVWATKDPGRTGRAAVRFFQPNTLTDVLIQVYEYFSNQASKQTGIPDYIGNQAKGVVASTLSMLMNAETKALKGVIMHIDKDVIRPSIKEHWLHIMLNDTKVRKMGDINVVARASEHMIVEEQMHLRRTEWLNATNNDVDMAIIGLDGRAAVLREGAKALKMPSEKVVPDEIEMERRMLEIRKQEQLALPVSPGTEGQAVDAAGGIPGEATRVNT